MSKRSSPSWQSQIAAKKKSAIIDAATDAFLRDGYDRTTLEAIARSAEVSTGTLFNHFATKSELFGAVMARVWGSEELDVGQDLLPAGDPKSGLSRIGNEYAQLLLAESTVALFRVIIAEAPRFPELGRELYERGKAPYLKRLQLYFESETAAGKLKISTQQIAIAQREFLGMINDQIFWPRLLIVGLEVDDADVSSVVESAVSTFFSRYSA